MTVKKYKLVTELNSVLSKVRVTCVGYMGKSNCGRNRIGLYCGSIGIFRQILVEVSIIGLKKHVNRCMGYTESMAKCKLGFILGQLD
jgi:hypothetical protein